MRCPCALLWISPFVCCPRQAMPLPLAVGPKVDRLVGNFDSNLFGVGLRCLEVRSYRVRNLKRKSVSVGMFFLTLLPLSNLPSTFTELTHVTFLHVNGARVASSSFAPRFATWVHPSLPGACANLVMNARRMSQSQHPSQSSRRSKKRAKDLTKKTKKTKLADSSGMLWRRNFLVCPPTICYKQSRLPFTS
jgi:hypothetical protein